FQVLALASGLLVLVILVLIAVTMSQQSAQWFGSEGWSGVFSTDWDPAHDKFGAMSFVYGTVIVSVIAIVVAYPVSMGVALLLNEVAPRRLARPIVSVIDLLAVVPSVVWGLWGSAIFIPWLQTSIYPHVASALNGIWILGNLFGPLNGNYVSGASFLTAGLVLAIMIIPIVTSLSREVMATVPTSDKDGAYALGATRLEVIRGVVWPHSQAGIVGATLLGLGRAMGETIVVALLMGSSPTITSHLLTPGYAMPGVIANQFGEATVGVFRAALIGMGVLLFALTIIVNLSARAIVSRNVRRMGGTA
ncbi:MAG: phosphate ABC transporter permease subunit PstC, partial [Trebonia sp.]